METIHINILTSVVVEPTYASVLGAHPAFVGSIPTEVLILYFHFVMKNILYKIKLTRVTVSNMCSVVFSSENASIETERACPVHDGSIR